MQSSEVTALICRLPLLAFSQYARCFSHKTPDADVGTIRKSTITWPFFQGRGPGHQTEQKYSAIPDSKRLLATTAFHRPRSVKRERKPRLCQELQSMASFVLPPSLLRAQES